MFRFKVADIVMDYYPYHEEFFGRRLSSYLCDEDKSDMRLEYQICENIELPTHKITSQVHEASVGSRDNGNLIMYFKAKSGKVMYYVEHSRDFSFNIAKSVSLKPTEKVPLTDCDREYLRSGAVFNNRLIYSGGTMLHGSSISYKGEGVIFSAPCGTGKSTHTALWKKLYDSDVTYINDDKPVITLNPDGVSVWGAPWSGKTELNTNTRVPLKAIVFIERAERNAIGTLSPSQAFCYLCDQTLPPFYSKELSLKNIETVEKIMASVPIYILSCNMEDDAAEIAKNKIFNN